MFESSIGTVSDHVCNSFDTEKSYEPVDDIFEAVQIGNTENTRKKINYDRKWKES